MMCQNWSRCIIKISYIFTLNQGWICTFRGGKLIYQPTDSVIVSVALKLGLFFPFSPLFSWFPKQKICIFTKKCCKWMDWCIQRTKHSSHWKQVRFFYFLTLFELPEKEYYEARRKWYTSQSSIYFLFLFFIRLIYAAKAKTCLTGIPAVTCLICSWNLNRNVIVFQVSLHFSFRMSSSVYKLVKEL